MACIDSAAAVTATAYTQTAAAAAAAGGGAVAGVQHQPAASAMKPFAVNCLPVPAQLLLAVAVSTAAVTAVK